MAIALRRADDPADTPRGENAAPQYSRIACSGCGTVITVDAAAAGTPIKCFQCGEFSIVPKGRYGPSSVIAGFVLEKSLFSSAIGDTYRAHQRSMDRPCMLKLLRRPAGDRDSVESFLKHARIGARLNHTNIVQGHAIGQEDDLLYCATEHTDSELLQRLLRRKLRLPAVQALDICRQIAAALGHAWKQENLAHGLLSPECVFVPLDGPVKVDDLGLRLGIVPHEVGSELAPYLLCRAPELIEGGEPNHKTDMYSLGCVLYQALTGEPVFPGKTLEDVNRGHIEGTPLPICERLPELHPRMGWLLDKLLAKSPGDRHPDWGAVVSAMDLLYAVTLDAMSPADKTTALLGSSTRTPVPTDTTPPVPEQEEQSTATKHPSIVRRMVTSCILILLTTAAVLAGAYALDRKTTLALLEQIPFLGIESALPIAEAQPPPEQQPDANPVEEAPEPPAVAEPATTKDDGPVTPPPLPPHAVRIAAAMPDPVGYDLGRETVKLVNETTDRTVDLSGWTLGDDDGRVTPLNGTIEPGQTMLVNLPREGLELNNLGKELRLSTPEGDVIDAVVYAAKDVAEGVELSFEPGQPGKPRK